MTDIRPIDANTLLNELEDLLSYVKLGEEHPYYNGEANALNVVIGKIKGLPAVDAVPVVRCMECKYSEHWYADRYRCFLWTENGIDVWQDGYCSYGERKTNNETN